MDPVTIPPPRADGAWGPSRALLGIVVLLLVVTMEAAVVGAFDPSLNSLGTKLVLQALLAATLAAVAFRMASTDGGFAPAEALGLRKPGGSAAKLAFTAYLAYFAFVIVYSNFVNPHQKDITRDLGYGDGVLPSITAGVLIVVAAPIAEEIFFRGFIFGGMRSRLPFLGAAVISAVIFGAFHFTGTGSLTVLPQLAALGLAQAWLYERSGSIYPTIAVHMANNALAFALLTH